MISDLVYSYVKQGKCVCSYSGRATIHSLIPICMVMTLNSGEYLHAQLLPLTWSINSLYYPTLILEWSSKFLLHAVRNISYSVILSASTIKKHLEVSRG